MSWGRAGSAGCVALVVMAAVLSLSGAASGAATDSESRPLQGVFASFPDYMDPGLSYTAEGWTAMYDTYIPLLTYRHADGIAGSEVIPGLARSLPRITNGGKTYTLFLRKGLRYSNGKRVRASDFTYALERTLRLYSGGSIFYTDIVGARRFARTKRGGILGIKANDRTGRIVIHLVRPRGSFTDELALMFAAPVPRGTPMRDTSTDPPPATGPYVITDSEPGRGWSYARNPEWGSYNSRLMPDLPSGHFEGMHISIVRNGSAEVSGVEEGRYDWMQNPPPPKRVAEFEHRYKGAQFRSEPTISTYYFWMNTRRPPFNDPRVRRAVNYAVNAEVLERIYAGGLTASHQILPANLPGHQPFDLYPYDLAKARKLIREAHPADRTVTVWTDNEIPNDEAGEYYVGVLRELGFHTKLKILNADYYFTVIGNRSTPNLDTGWSDWYEDYPHPNDFFQPLLDGKSILPTYNGNFANIDVPALNGKIAKLGREHLGPMQEAAYAELDRSYMERAPWIPFGARTLSTFVSSAIDLEKVIWNPTFGVDLTSLQLK
jgi:peptide/nickel transport system substrate-binding protein